MSTHATLSVCFPDGSISGCYVHYDGDSMKGRIQSFLEGKTTTCLSVLIAEAQGSGGMRSFHHPVRTMAAWPSSGRIERCTELMDDNEPYVIDEKNWDDNHFGANYRYMVNYETKDIKVNMWSATQRLWIVPCHI